MSKTIETCDELGYFLKRITAEQEFSIYGSEVIAYSAYRAIKEIAGKKPCCFLVSSKVLGEQEIEGIPIMPLSVLESGKQLFILIATSELFHDEIILNLNGSGYSNFFALESNIEFLLMNSYFSRFDMFSVLETNESERAEVPNVAIYKTVSEYDVPLVGKYMSICSKYEIDLHSGAVLSKQRLADSADCTGDNISDKNLTYGEATSIYWIWKNINTYDYKGKCHYRRHFRISDNQFSMMKGQGIDVVLPLPYICPKTMLWQYQRFVGADFANETLNVLEKMFPASQFRLIFFGKYAYAYNMVIAKNNVYNEYCSWLFSVLLELEKVYLAKINEFPKRSLAYASEYLTSAYFLVNSEALKIRHAEIEINK